MVIEVAWPVSSLEDCRSACVNASVCRAIEFDGRRQRCQVWSVEPESSVASEGSTCLAFRPEKVAHPECPASWPKPNETWCARPGENCMATGCCEDPSLSCFAKDGFWAACKPVCEPGQVDVVGDAVKYQTPWSCGLLGCGSYPGRVVPPGRWWSPPENATQHNGARLADVYIPGNGAHRVFIIGDWGGLIGGEDGSYVSPASQVHQRVHGEFVDGVDDRAQFRVRDAMVSRAAHTPPDYVLNVGDNFYWAGVEEHCNSGAIGYTGSQQFEVIYERVYAGRGIDGKQWLGVLGNHDYGGYRFEMGWDKTIGYTWASPTGRWMTPALYYSVKVWYYDFAVDYIFMDTNVWDALDPADPSSHNICSQQHNPPDATCDPIGPTSIWDCPFWFRGLWEQQKAWLDGLAPGLDGDWRLAVTHFPPYWGHLDCPGQDMARRHEIDLVISGHRHSQSGHTCPQRPSGTDLARRPLPPRERLPGPDGLRRVRRGRRRHFRAEAREQRRGRRVRVHGDGPLEGQHQDRVHLPRREGRDHLAPVRPQRRPPRGGRGPLGASRRAPPSSHGGRARGASSRDLGCCCCCCCSFS
ncbi:unnamed protein product [Prorocentrum cordatum]|uniref:Apple domain-containing protein n=1 Tax=Prorocentrum cordatum TaxID=2364126 RepID=A0ABN9VTR7_9DINO|nr:unnamed protein product [Polarella glacialis]